MTKRGCKRGSRILTAGILLSGLLVSAPACLAQDSSTSADRVATSTPTPTASGQYVPLTEKDRLRQYWKSIASPRAVLCSAVSASIGQWRDRPEEWGEGARGFGLRMGSSYAEHVTLQTLMFGASSLLHEDNRYVPSGESNMAARARYAAANTFLARRDDGSKRVSISKISALAGAALISRLWQPPKYRNLSGAGSNFATSVGLTFGFDFAREFWPWRQ